MLLAIKRTYPDAGVFADEAFAGESARPGGGQRSTIAALSSMIVTHARASG